MKLLVTGGAGFIGSHIVDGEVARGSEVVVVDNLSTGKKENLGSDVPFYCVDICNRDEIFRVFREFRPEVVSHQAAQASVSISVKDPYGDAMVNVMGTLNVLEACREFGVKHFVFASTGGAIYGEVPENSKASEEWTLNPKSPYAVAKASVEHYLRVYRHNYGLSYTILRYANVYGPRQDPYGEAGVVAIFCERILRGLEVTVYARRSVGDEGCIRDYVYVGDVEKAHSLAVRGRLLGVFNVSTGKGTTTRRLLELISSIAGKKPGVLFAPPRPGDLEVSILDNSKISSYVDGWTELEDGIRKTVEWFSRSLG
ncbi:NAD-dependent epimerase/dehydratase family protein [Thermodesulforhabdus norvegica]|uniref:UDP-glucose 4-epimerase n=1 Tax=Thermodesulforhabdus norvegica TaxID=39841 RepID=A0A1I4SLN4_9BACT|nr:NAD-dependent epimerase/dehydratase family protein [Thermodesulforhabdus norvegica]SFM65342.1 UDP-glucose 4-epimerase [Thermodesulforhabdus norvegica]